MRTNRSRRFSGGAKLPDQTAACEHGFGRARDKLSVSNGAPWIWNVVADRWPGAVQVLGLYCANQHEWALGEAVHGAQETARPWMAKHRRQPRHRRQAAALRQIVGLRPARSATGEVARREQDYLTANARHLNGGAMTARGWAIGSGPVDSACLQQQGRFKRSAQLWTPQGQQDLCALFEARQNGHRDALWNR